MKHDSTILTVRFIHQVLVKRVGEEEFEPLILHEQECDVQDTTLPASAEAIQEYFAAKFAQPGITTPPARFGRIVKEPLIGAKPERSRN